MEYFSPKVVLQLNAALELLAGVSVLLFPKGLLVRKMLGRGAVGSPAVVLWAALATTVGTMCWLLANSNSTEVGLQGMLVYHVLLAFMGLNSIFKKCGWAYSSSYDVFPDPIAVLVLHGGLGYLSFRHLKF